MFIFKRMFAKPMYNFGDNASPEKSGAGFTLIELLVVISIIGLLASVVLVSVNSAMVKARDARRLADLKQIRNALELYITDNGNYPGFGNPNTYYWISDNNYPGTVGYPPCATSGGLASYMANVCIVKDSQGNPYGYSIDSNGQYKLGAKFELSANQGNVFTYNNGSIPVAGWYEPK